MQPCYAFILLFGSLGFLGKVAAQMHMCTRLRNNEPFQVIHYFTSINYTQPPPEYQPVVSASPNDLSVYSAFGIQVQGGNIYLALPRNCKANVATLVQFPLNSSMANPLLTPYPSWEANDLSKGCASIQSVLALQVDTKGILWVLDGKRDYNPNNCPPKLVLVDLSNGSIIHSYVFPESVTPWLQTWLCEIVIDESDGGFAYIADGSQSDPGIVVYSRSQDASWKFRDRSMFAEIDAAGFSVQGVKLDVIFQLHGLALQPPSSPDRRLLYSAFTGYTIYSVCTAILKNQTRIYDASWRKTIKEVGQKCSPGTGMTMDSKTRLYLSMSTTDSIGEWNPRQGSFDQAAYTAYTNHTTINSPDSFAIDCSGNLYFTSTGQEKFFSPQKPPAPIRILQRNIGAQSYLHG